MLNIYCPCCGARMVYASKHRDTLRYYCGVCATQCHVAIVVAFHVRSLGDEESRVIVSQVEKELVGDIETEVEQGD